MCNGTILKRFKSGRTLCLFEVANLSGFEVSKTDKRHESECITKIVQLICSKCRQFFNVERDLVGIDSRVHDLKLILGTELDVVRFVGIWGIGGAGKTTLAWAVYNEISYQFEGKCFVENVKELSRQNNGLLIYKNILSEILFDKSLEVNSTHEGKGLMQSRLRHKKVLLVLDDVDNNTQLDALAGSHEWFGKGSRIIITTRDQRWLIRPTPILKYNASLLNDAEAIQLFSLNAFAQDSPPELYKDDSYHLVRQTGGFPLALKVLGSSLYGSTIGTMDEWKSALSRLEAEGEDEVSKVLKVSYDGLKDFDQKILLDIACFFKGENIDRVTRILDSFEFHALHGIKCLVHRSLISISNNRIHMHDRIQEMGRQIVRRTSDQPSEHSRLWFHDDVYHVLTTKTGTDAVEGISHKVVKDISAIKFDAMSFKNMNKLRLLELNQYDVFVPKKLGWLSKANKYFRRNSRASVDAGGPFNLRWLTWEGCRLDSLPEFLGTLKLVGLEMPHSQIVQLWKEGEVLSGKKILDKLIFIDLSNSIKLQQTPCLNLAPNLRTLNLEGCTKMVYVHPSIGDHRQLVFLSLKNCSYLQRLPDSIEMNSLETLILSNCRELKRFPEIKLDGTSLEQLPASVGKLSGLVLMDLTMCRSLTSLPSTICELKSLKRLYLTKCEKLEKLPENLGEIQSLEEFWSDGTQIKEAPSSMGLLTNIKTFSFSGCKELMPSMLSILFPGSSGFCSIRCLFLDLCNLTDGDIPADLSPLSCLEELNLSYNLFKYLPQGISHLPRLKILDVCWCVNLYIFEANLPSGIAILKADWTAKSTSFPNLSTKYDSLWKISYFNYYEPIEQPTTNILKSLFKGLLVANHRFSLTVKGCHIPKWFRKQRKKKIP